MDTELDIVVFGATGFVGRLVAQELLARAPKGCRIALAGRNRAALTGLARQLGRPDLPVVVADAFDQQALDAMARRTAVVVSTVGPYLKYGAATVAACATHGTHYVDLNGEVLFARETIDRHHETARRTGASIVHACGFDSIPSDLGVLLAADAAREAGAGDLLGTTMHLRSLSGGMSGGTIDALRHQIDSSRKRPRTASLPPGDPYCLSDDRDAEPEPRSRRNTTVWLESSADTKEFAAPFFMARYNEQVVRRSNGLLGHRYGRAFRYREVHDTGTGAKGLVKALGIAAALPALVGVLTTPGLRQVADRLLPSPGEGPSERTRHAGHFTMEVHAETTSGRRVVATVSDDRDPGYSGTAVMLSQAALALAAGEQLASGVLTPAVALGHGLAERLRRQGFTLTTRVDEPTP